MERDNQHTAGRRRRAAGRKGEGRPEGQYRRGRAGLGLHHRTQVLLDHLRRLIPGLADHHPGPVASVRIGSAYAGQRRHHYDRW